MTNEPLTAEVRHLLERLWALRKTLYENHSIWADVKLALDYFSDASASGMIATQQTAPLHARIAELEAQMAMLRGLLGNFEKECIIRPTDGGWVVDTVGLEMWMDDKSTALAATEATAKTWEEAKLKPLNELLETKEAAITAWMKVVKEWEVENERLKQIATEYQSLYRKAAGERDALPQPLKEGE